MVVGGGGGLLPVPESAREVGELEALLTATSAPVKLPTADGAKLTLKAVLCPPVRVKGTTSPLLKVVPLRLSPDTTTVPVPILLRVTDCVVLPPLGMLPKATLLGVNATCEATGG
jgi:hypothetical protein